jgi:predicted  nucleic acid-binding Zn-ribbon protein
VNTKEDASSFPTPKWSSRSTLVLVILALLAIGEIYSIARISTVRHTLENRQALMSKELDIQFSAKLAALEDSNAKQLSVLRTELDRTAGRMGSTGQELNRARAMVAGLQKRQQQQADELKKEIATKADDEKLGALSQDVSSTQTDLASTKQNIDELSKDLGMAKSELGTLIARNHDDVEALRKLGERDYFEFTLAKNARQNIAGVGLMLKKTNVKHSRFDLNLTADDLQVEKKGRSIDEPIFFFLAGSKRSYELVINKVESDRVTGYMSTPKGATQEMAAR